MAETQLVINPENTALIIHDMENGFWKPPLYQLQQGRIDHWSNPKYVGGCAAIENAYHLHTRSLRSPAIRILAEKKDRRHAGCGAMR